MGSYNCLTRETPLLRETFQLFAAASLTNGGSEFKKMYISHWMFLFSIVIFIIDIVIAAVRIAVIGMIVIIFFSL